MALHRRDQAHQDLAGHHAIGVQDQELRIGTAEPLHPVGDVAGLAGGVLRTAAIEDPIMAAGALAQCQEGGLLVEPHLRLDRVAQDEDVKRVGSAQAAQRFVDRLQPCRHAGRRLVVGRHQQRGAGRWQREVPLYQPSAAAEYQRDEAGERAGERQGDPGEQRQEQQQHEDRERDQPVRPQHQVHLVRRRPRSARWRRQSPAGAASQCRAATRQAEPMRPARSATTASASPAASPAATPGTPAPRRHPGEYR